MEMTMTDDKLPSLSLDDLRVAEPDRDNEAAFDPQETWHAARDKMEEGYSAATVADVLMELDDNERGALADYWREHTLSTLQNPAWDGRDFLAHDLRVAMAMQEREPDCEAWGCAPTLEPASLWETVAEFDRMKAENAKLRALLDDARDLIAEWQEQHVYDGPNGEKADPEDAGPTLLAAIDAALGKEGAR